MDTTKDIQIPQGNNANRVLSSGYLSEALAKPDIDYSQIDNVEFENINHRDAPDYSDTYIISADYKGREMTEIEIEALDSGFVYEKLIEYLL